MSTTLGQFQHAFIAALRGDREFAPARQRAFDVYRNTVLKACIDALEANFPAVVRLVGTEWFRAAAAVYASRHPPVERSLLRYGEGLAAFLADFEPASDLPYLPGVASLDLLWLQAHCATDEVALDTADLVRMSAQSVGELYLRPHASARWAWFADLPVYSIWDANRGAHDAGPELHWKGEGALLVRNAGVVRWMRMDEAGCQFMDACRAGLSLGEAMAARLTESPAAQGDPADWLVCLLGAGVFSKETAQ